MSTKAGFRLAVVAVILGLAGLGAWYALHEPRDPKPNAPNGDSPKNEKPEEQFATQVRPFVEQHCVSCHSGEKPKGGLDLSRDLTAENVASRPREWGLVLDRLRADEMPPEDAPNQPKPEERAQVVAWLSEFRAHEAERSSGDPVIVLARRLSNAEFDCTIRDLTGVDIRPTREFPVDPANQAGFDNSGESLTMSPALLKKYLAAARHIADHVVLKQNGFVFASHPAVTDTDRDRYCVQRIMDFYEKHRVDYVKYFLAAWAYRYREALAQPTLTLDEMADELRLNRKYLAVIWAAITDNEANVGPMAVVRKLWNDLDPPRPNQVPSLGGYEKMRDTIVLMRERIKPDVQKLSVNGISQGSQWLMTWRNQQLALKHCSYGGNVKADLKKIAEQFGDEEAGLAKLLMGDGADEKVLRASVERFASAFPDTFVVTERAPYYDAGSNPKGRLLSAGFHLMHGYYRDDGLLYELILNEKERAELDALWAELDFVTLSPMRQYKDFIFFERAEPPRFMIDAEFDFARSEDKDAISEAKIAKLSELYLAKAKKTGANAEALDAIKSYFTNISADIRRVEKARLAAEPSHLDALLKFAERAFRRPLSAAERDDLLAFYRTLRDKDGLGHEEAIRDVMVSVLMSPRFCYRLDFAARPGGPLTDYELASRLSYFLWSSMPDDELLSRAAAGDLRNPDVLRAQTRRMLLDPKARGLATEFAGNWLDIRRFEEHNAVDRERFKTFTNELRLAMFEEPIRYFLDAVQRDRSVLDLLYGTDTFVNRPLAKHYGTPEPSGDGWIHLENADKYGRGGLLPMAVFLTKNAPGLRTSPVKRGYWVVTRVLGERIPPPPPTVPELPKDEANLGDLTLPQLLARHREEKSCAACHARFDSLGLVFEGFGPVGERRTKDLGNKPVADTAPFPDGVDREGIDGLRQYLRDKRQDDFIDNLCRKLFVYALGRTLQPSDDAAIAETRAKLAADGYKFGTLVEAIVTSKQFLNKRGNGPGVVK
jgi:hypothetical protein